MLTKLSTTRIRKTLVILLLVLFPSKLLLSQSVKTDSLSSAAVATDKNDAKQKKSQKKVANVNLATEALYEAEDSLVMDKKNEKAYLYHNAMVSYENIVLKAEYIEIDFKNNIIHATGKADSTGKIIGTPTFKEGDDEYKASEINYNFETKKGIISNVNKNENDVYVWIERGKKMPDDITYVKSGHFTTCSDANPHYRIVFKKGKIIPNDKIITGPIYIEIEGIPIPIVIPFGIIPNTTKRTNGVLFPSYGYAANRGYNLTDGGYYWGLGPHMDLALRGDIYSRLSWGVKALSRYNFRYKGSGSIDLRYANNKYGETDTWNYNKDETFFIRWQHQQAAKANPYTRFSANVNFGSTQYNKLNSTNSNDYLTNTFQSSISYSARIGNGYNLSVGLNHSQNSQTGAINLTLPQVAFSTPRYYPFQNKNNIGKSKWYEKIMLSYKLDAKNSLNTVDSMFEKSSFQDFDKAIQQVIPINSTIALGNFNLTNSVELKERWYFKTINRSWINDTTIINSDTIAPHIQDATIYDFKAVHEANFTSSINTRLYGMYMFKKCKIIAIRHVMTPTLSFNYRPDFGAAPFNYYQEYTDGNGNTIRYNTIEGQMYGSPSDGKAGIVRLYFDNNIEMKVKSKKDTITGTKKIKLIDNINFGTSYNIAATEFALAPLTLSARSTLYKGLSVRYDAYWDFYGKDSLGQRINEFNWNLGKPILHLNSDEWNLGFNYSLQSGHSKQRKQYSSNKGTPEQLETINNHPEEYVDFNNAWNVNISYTFRYLNAFNATQNKFENNLIQTIGLNGSINITSKWKIGTTTGWDFQANKLSYTSIDIYRDLHCWELLFNWIPMGYRKSYNLTIRIKSPMLQDLKLNRTRNWRDY